VGVSSPTADTLAEVLRPLTEAPERAAILCDVDGTLAPIVERAQDAKVPDQASRLLGALAKKYALVACISGRGALDAKRLVGVGGIAYAGAHGAELLDPGAKQPTTLPAFASWQDKVQEFAHGQDLSELRSLRVRIEDKGPIVAFHWRGAPDEGAARTKIEGIAAEGEAAGFITHWGRKVLEIRPPVEVNKGQAVEQLAARSQVRTALFGGDDATDLDGFAALDRLLDQGKLDARVRVGVESDEGPAQIVERADLVVNGIPGFLEVLEALADPAR
jgi:trehalose 6-phosphate phosphatase